MKNKIAVLMILYLISSLGYAKDYFGAIAINENTGIAGGAINYPNTNEAVAAANLSCRKKNGNKGKCEPAVNFFNSCGAVAWSPTMKRSESGLNSNSYQGAEKDAFQDCSKSGLSDCKIVMSFCTLWETYEEVWW